MRYVIDNFTKCQSIFQQLYNKNWHKKQENIYRQIAKKYQSENL